MRFPFVMIASLCFHLACGKADVQPVNTAPKTVSNTMPNVAGPRTNPPDIKDGDYPGKGKVTKLSTMSVELDHEDIPGLMPAMKMEFYVSDKALLTGIAVGDKVAFTILYKGGTETITKIGKTK